MYSYITGILKAKLPGAAVVDNHGIGYRINTVDRTLANLHLGEEVTFHTYLHVREDNLSLFGFTEMEGVALFELLLTVSGIGPKAALSICAAGSPAQAYGAIVSKDIAWLTRAQGIGRKTAERLVLELKEKIAKDMTLSEAVSGGDGPIGVGVDAQALAALLGLGYQEGEVVPALRQAVALLGPEASVEALLRTVLKTLAQGR
jgi:Holliday junction DNA helicase RuvA